MLRFFAVVMVGKLLALHACAKTTIVFLNSPETLKQSGVVAKIDVIKGSSYRFFFHYLNYTGKDQTFRLIGPLSEMYGGGSCHVSPGMAGSNAGKKFLQLIPVNSPIQYMVKAGNTVSGIIECIAGESGTVVASLGEDKTAIPHKIQISKEYQRDIVLEPAQVSTFSIGNGKPEIQGSYGTVFRIDIQNRMLTDETISIDLNPRGGPIAMPYQINDDVFLSPVIGAKSNARLYSGVLKAGKDLVFQTVIPGGWNLPVRFSIRTKVTSSLPLWHQSPRLTLDPKLDRSWWELPQIQ